MSTTPTPAPAPQMSRLDSILMEILTYGEVITSVAAVVPSPVMAFAPMALSLEKIAAGVISAHAAATGQTPAQSIAAITAQLHTLNPTP